MDSQNGGRSARRCGRFYAQSMVPIGEGVFETLKVVDSQPHALARHLERLTHSATALGLDRPEAGYVEREIATHLRDRPLALGRLRIIWAAGPTGGVLSVDSAPTSPPAPTVRLSRSSWRVDASSGLSGHKTTAYVDYALAMREAQAAGFDDALLANTAGEVCETSTANVFYVLDGVLHTPARSSGCLPGIARARVLELCDVVETSAPISVLEQASEVFVTSSLREVQPVSRIDGTTYETAGPVTAEVIARWRDQADDTWDPASRN